VFEAGWVKVEEKWDNPELAEFWQQLRQLRTDVNKVLEQARVEKMIGSSLEAKAVIYIKDDNSRNAIATLNPEVGNGIDELRYLFLTSQVDLSTPLSEIIKLLPDKLYSLQFENWTIGVVNADGEKCDRCWNYSTHVGESTEHPLLCERCVPALAGEF
jgi:isoleucyl-tRNA synthetase